jgi:hypothetical protein
MICLAWSLDKLVLERVMSCEGGVEEHNTAAIDALLHDTQECLMAGRKGCMHWHPSWGGHSDHSSTDVCPDKGKHLFLLAC